VTTIAAAPPRPDRPLFRPRVHTGETTSRFTGARSARHHLPQVTPLTTRSRGASGPPHAVRLLHAVPTRTVAKFERFLFAGEEHPVASEHPFAIPAVETAVDFQLGVSSKHDLPSLDLSTQALIREIIMANHVNAPLSPSNFSRNRACQFFFRSTVRPVSADRHAQRGLPDQNLCPPSRYARRRAISFPERSSGR